MKPKRVVLAIVILLLAAAGVFWALRPPERAKPLLLSGTIEARDVGVGSLVGGRVREVHVDEGDQVTAGQPLVTLETDLIDAQIREQQARVDEARAIRTRAQRGPRSEETARARADWDNAESNRRRLERLLAEGIIGRQQYDEAATRARTALELYRERARGSRPEDIDAAEAAVAREEGRLAYAMRQKAEAVVRAPAGGTVEVFDLRPGDLVAVQQPVARLLEPGQLWVRVYVPEPSLGRVRVGQKAHLRVDSFPGREFPGRVVEIGNQAEYTPRNVQTLQQRMDQVFGVKVAIDDPGDLRPGMAAIVRLEE
ncbi:MAG: HlyD family secretion protein [Thermoanaerobaculia bacterium]